MTSHGCSLEIVPLILSTSRANIHHMRPTEWWPCNQMNSLEIRDGIFWLWQVPWPHLVITRNSNVHISQRWVCIAQSNGGNVDIRCLRQWLMVSSGVSHNQKSWLSESCLDLIGESTRGETTMESRSTSGSSKLQNSSLEWQFMHKVLHFYIVIQVWLRSPSNASHKTKVLMALIKTCSLTLAHFRHLGTDIVA